MRICQIRNALLFTNSRRGFQCHVWCICWGCFASNMKKIIWALCIWTTWASGLVRGRSGICMCHLGPCGLFCMSRAAASFKVGPGLVKGRFFEIRLRFWLRLGFAFGLLINSGFSWNEWREQNCEFHVWAGHRLRAAKMQINPNEWQKNTQQWNRTYMSKYKRACSWSPFHCVKTWYMDV